MMPFHFPGQTGFYSGKVRDVYTIHDSLLIMIATNRISAFDKILPVPIPYKGQVLNEIAAYMLKKTEDICPNWLLSAPAPQVSAGRKCKPFKLEIVVRGNLSGHAWRTYATGTRILCGARLEDGLTENDFFSTPVITPSTKADKGHDEEISPEQIVERQIASAEEYKVLEQYSLALFARGRELAAERGLILADTKYEFGKIGSQIYLLDEIHTPDSSRYFYADGFHERQKAGTRQRQLSKEFVREWLIANGFTGKEEQKIPPMTPEWIAEISDRYIELYELLLGVPFQKQHLSTREVYEKTVAWLDRRGKNDDE